MEQWSFVGHWKIHGIYYRFYRLFLILKPLDRLRVQTRERWRIRAYVYRLWGKRSFKRKNNQEPLQLTYEASVWLVKSLIQGLAYDLAMLVYMLHFKVFAVHTTYIHALARRTGGLMHSHSVHMILQILAKWSTSSIDSTWFTQFAVIRNKCSVCIQTSDVSSSK